MKQKLRLGDAGTQSGDADSTPRHGDQDRHRPLAHEVGVLRALGRAGAAPVDHAGRAHAPAGVGRTVSGLPDAPGLRGLRVRVRDRLVGAGAGDRVTVIAPSRMERTPGLQVKTDRLDAGKMVRKLEQGELKGIYVPVRDGHEQRQSRSVLPKRPSWRTATMWISCRIGVSATRCRSRGATPGSRCRWSRSSSPRMAGDATSA